MADGQRPDPRPDFYGGDRKTLYGQGIRLAKENPQRIAVAAARLAGKTGGVVADILLNPKEAGAGSDKVPMKNVDNSGLTKEPLP